MTIRESILFHLLVLFYSDIDECANETDNLCHKQYGLCENTNGSYNCSCLPGFSGDGITCESKASKFL